MPSTVEKLSPTRAKLTIEMPFEDLKPAIDKAYHEIAGQVNLPGFRKGKVPPSLIDQRFGRGTVLQEAINEALPSAYAEATAEHDLHPLGQPDVEVTKLEDGELVEFTAEVDIRPDFDLPDAGLVRVEVDSTNVTDDDVNERVDLLRQRFATMTDVDRVAQEGDIVVFDLEANQDGVALPDAQAEGLNYKVGSGGMVDGLDEAITGMSAGDSKSFSSTLVGGAQKGEEADIKVTIHKVQEQELPALDDDFAQLVSEFDTKEEMLDDLREGLTRMGRVSQANDARDKVLESYLELIEFDLPEKLIEDQKEGFRSNIESQLSQAGLTLEEYLKQTESEDADSTPEEFWADVDKNAELALRAQIVLDKLADERQVPISQEDLSQLIWNKARENGTTPEQETQHMMDHNHLGEWMGEIRRGKALALLTSQAQVVDTDGNPVELSRLQSDGTYLDAAAEENAEVASESEEQPDAHTVEGEPGNDESTSQPTKTMAAEASGDANPVDGADQS